MTVFERTANSIIASHDPNPIAGAYPEWMIKAMEAYKNQSQPIEKEQERIKWLCDNIKSKDNEIERLQKTLSRYSNQEITVSNQQQEIERLKHYHKFQDEEIDKFRSAHLKAVQRIKELEAQLKEAVLLMEQIQQWNIQLTFSMRAELEKTIVRLKGESSPTEQPEAQKEKDWTCYEIWRPNIPDDGCKEQCKECKQKQQNQPQPESEIRRILDANPFPQEWLDNEYKVDEPQPEKAQEEQSELEKFIEWCAKEKKAGELSDIYKQFKETRKAF